MTEKSKSFAERINEGRELLQAVGEALSEKLEEKLMESLPGDAPIERVLCAYPDFLESEPALGKVLLGLKNGTLEAQDASAFLHEKEYVNEEVKNWEQQFVDGVKKALAHKPGMKQIVDTGKLHKYEESFVREDIAAVLAESTLLAATRSSYKEAELKRALYSEVAYAIGDPEVAQAIALNKHAERSR